MSASDLRGPGVPGDGSAAAGDAHGAVMPSAHSNRASVSDSATAADHSSIAGAGMPGVSDSTTAGLTDATTDNSPARVSDSISTGAGASAGAQIER